VRRAKNEPEKLSGAAREREREGQIMQEVKTLDQ